MNLIARLLGRSAPATETPAQRKAWLEDVTSRTAQAIATQTMGGLREARRSFAAAERPAWLASMPTTAGDINEDLAAQLPILRGTAKSAARDNEWAARYLIQLEDNVLAENGIALQMRVKLPNGDLDSEANALIEAFFAKWGADADHAKRHDWRDMESLLLGSLPRSGEFLLRHRTTGRYGYQVEMLPAELLDVGLRRTWEGRRVRMGVELYDSGEPAAYWIRASLLGDAVDGTAITVGKHVRIPASEIEHGFEASEVGQLRGVPWLSTGARRLWLLNDFEEAAAVASSNAAKRQGFFVSPDGNAPPGMADTIISSVLEAARASGKELSVEEIAALTASAEKYATTMPGQFDTLPSGYDFRAFESKWPEISAEAHVRGHIRGFAAARGVSYHTLGNDLADVNYSSAQVGIADERKHFRVIQRRLIRWLHQPVIERVVRRAVLYESGLKPSRLQAYIDGIQWQPPTWQPIDDVKAANADDTRLRNKSTTRRRIWIEKGLDPEEMQAEVLAEEKIFGPLETSTKPQDTAPAEPVATGKKTPGG